MTNENILTKKELKEQREKIIEFSSRRFAAQKESMRQCKENKINIDSTILDLLEELGFDRKYTGTNYLALVISDLYHERKVFDSENDYFDFSDDRNNHYSFANEFYECGLTRLLERIKISIENSYVSDKSINEIIYDVANDVIGQYDRPGKQLVYKSK